MGELPILAGMLYCADCGSKMFVCRTKAIKPEDYFYSCGTYRKCIGKCSSHAILIRDIDRIVLEDINKNIEFAKKHEDEFVKMVTNQTMTQINKALKGLNKEVSTAKTRIAKLDTIIQNLYEDKLTGTISEDRFNKMSLNFEKEQAELNNKVADLESKISAINERTASTTLFLTLESLN